MRMWLDKHSPRAAHLLWSLFLFLYPMLVLFGRCIEAHESTQCDSRPVTIPLSGSAVAHKKELLSLVLTIHSFVSSFLLHVKLHTNNGQDYPHPRSRAFRFHFNDCRFSSSSSTRLFVSIPPFADRYPPGQASSRSLAWQSSRKGLFCIPGVVAKLTSAGQ